MVSAPLLKLFDNNRSTMIKTDTSAFGVGVIHEQEYSDGWHVVAYASTMMDTHQKNYQTSEKKLYAIVFACKKCRHYLLGKMLTVVTDPWAFSF